MGWDGMVCWGRLGLEIDGDIVDRSNVRLCLDGRYVLCDVFSTRSTSSANPSAASPENITGNPSQSIALAREGIVRVYKSCE